MLRFQQTAITGMNFAGMCQGMIVLGHHYLSQWENQQNMNFRHQHLVPAFFNGKICHGKPRKHFRIQSIWW
jgi:hypothetical protein